MSPLRFFCVWAAARLLGFPHVCWSSRQLLAWVGVARSAWGNLLTGWMAAKAQRQELRRRLTASQCHTGSLAAIASPGDWRTRLKRDVTFHEWRTWPSHGVGRRRHVRQDHAEQPQRPNDAEGLVELCRRQQGSRAALTVGSRDGWRPVVDVSSWANDLCLSTAPVPRSGHSLCSQ